MISQCLLYVIWGRVDDVSSFWGRQVTVMRRPGSGKIYLLLVVIAILGCTLFLNASLNYLNYARNLKVLTNSRFSVIAQDLINSVEYGLNLGLDLREISTIQNLLAETRQQHNDISELFVIDEKDGLLFHSRADVKLMDAGLAAIIKEVDMNKRNTLVFSNMHYLIYPLTNQFNVRVGSLFLGYSSSLTEGMLAQAVEWFALHFIVAFAVCSLVIILVLGSIYSGFLGSLKKVRELLDMHARGAMPMDEAGAQTIFGADFSEFCSGSLRLAALLEEAERSMEKIENEN